jgi:hypothetical protein
MAIGAATPTAPAARNTARRDSAGTRVRVGDKLIFGLPLSKKLFRCDRAGRGASIRQRRQRRADGAAMSRHIQHVMRDLASGVNGRGIIDGNISL